MTAIILPDNMRGVIDVIDKPRSEVKWYKKEATKEGVCFHHSAVGGGFGTHKRKRKLYEGKEPSFSEWDLALHDEFTPDEWVRAQALAHRYVDSNLPYHAIHSAQNVLYKLHRPQRTTWHGNGANRKYLGFCWDANSKKDGLPVEALKESIRWVVDDARKDGNPIDKFTCHCAWTKPLDPGSKFILRVMQPLAAELGCTIDLDFAKNKGRSIAEVLRRAS